MTAPRLERRKPDLSVCAVLSAADSVNQSVGSDGTVMPAIGNSPMSYALLSTLAALLGAIIGGVLSVLASWLAQRVQTRTLWLTQELRRREDLYSEFIDAAAKCYAMALTRNESDTDSLAELYAEMGRMRVISSPAVLREARVVVDKILDAFLDPNRDFLEVREMLTSHSIDLFSSFSQACRVELEDLRPRHI
jgi:hypothetical protein